MSYDTKIRYFLPKSFLMLLTDDCLSDMNSVAEFCGYLERYPRSGRSRQIVKFVDFIVKCRAPPTLAPIAGRCLWLITSVSRCHQSYGSVSASHVMTVTVTVYSETLIFSVWLHYVQFVSPF